MFLPNTTNLITDFVETKEKIVTVFYWKASAKRTVFFPAEKKNVFDYLNQKSTRFSNPISSLSASERCL